ncbi:hypothetical protein [Gordonia oryzae]|uniref:hypothetical protein n=1 Tax=Gordonia oryzae TaxID=2487349 RepID=UPI001C849241|nr:hypothetical protein [Gordonia oryzae]
MALSQGLDVVGRQSGFVLVFAVVEDLLDTGAEIVALDPEVTVLGERDRAQHHAVVILPAGHDYEMAFSLIAIHALSCAGGGSDASLGENTVQAGRERRRRTRMW